MQRFVTDFGVIDAPTKHDADRLAYRRWLEDGWRQGGYKPLTREEFADRYLKNIQTIEGQSNGPWRR